MTGAVCSRRDKNREIRHLMYGENAKKSIGEIYEGMEIFGLNKGQYSIINIIEEILKQTGKADVLISTWTAANSEIKKAEKFLDNGLINKLHFILDRSFKTRQKKYYDILMERFGDVVSETSSHCKFTLIKNDEWNIVIRTSMNLNENKRLENFEISDDENLYNYLAEIAADIMKVDFQYFRFDELGHDEKYDKLRVELDDSDDLSFLDDIDL